MVQKGGEKMEKGTELMLTAAAIAAVLAMGKSVDEINFIGTFL